MTPTQHRRVVVVVGPGRSGTSTMAGALAHCGYVVPDPIQGDASNPRGFHEPRWVIDLHTELLRRIGVRTLDTDPGALGRVEAVVHDDEVRRRVRAWLSARLDENERLVVKDPRAVWFTELWATVAEELGCEPGFVMMLRHPAEVSSSRHEYYGIREVTAVAGWVNVALMTERLTAGRPRVVVHYPRLTADWRTELVRVRDGLRLQLDPPPEHSPHPVDDFVDRGLRRMRVEWDHLQVPAFLRDLADPTFEALGALAERGDSAEVSARLDDLRAAYARLHDDALAVVRPHVRRSVDEAGRRSARRARERARARTATPAQASSDGLLRKVVRRIRAGT